MRAVQISQNVQNVDELQVSTVPDPIPQPNQYTITIGACSPHLADILQIRGKYQIKPPFPYIPGFEFAGKIIAVPKELPFNKTPRFNVGDRVFGGAQGSFATKVCAVEDQMRKIPEGMQDTEAAGLFVTTLTSYAALKTRAQLKRNEWILIHGAAGGVGVAAVQVAKALGATVIATCGSKRKMEVARGFGADYVINYREQDFLAEVNKITNNRGVDVVYDPVGLISKSIRCTAWNGRLIVIGFTFGDIEKVPMNKVLLREITIMGFEVWSYARPPYLDEHMDAMLELVKQGKLSGGLYTDRKFTGLEQLPQALNKLLDRTGWGKLAITIPEYQESSKL